MEDVIQISESRRWEELKTAETWWRATAHDLLSDFCQKNKALEYIL